MIGVSVTFTYDGDFDRARVEKVATESRAMFEGMAGLRSKVYAVDEKHQRAMNFYVWDSRDLAERFFSDALRARVLELYGTEPEIEYFDVAELVDNANP